MTITTSGANCCQADRNFGTSRHTPAWSKVCVWGIVALLGAACPVAAMGDQGINWGQVRKFTEQYKPLLQEPDAAGTIASQLAVVKDQEEVYARVMAIGYALERDMREPVAGGVFDGLRERGSLEATILAADVLLKTVMASRLGSDVRSFPDTLCERAASLLDHPDPVVQAMAEWTLTLRVKKVNASIWNHIDWRISPSTCDKPWYVKWIKRPASRQLSDDYCRQLVQLNRHGSLAGLTMDVDRIESRMKALRAAPGTVVADSAEAKRRHADYEAALMRTRQAITAGDLRTAHQCYPGLRVAARKLLTACRPEFPREGIAFFTGCAIPGGQSNVNGAVIGGTNPPGGDVFLKRGADPAVPATPLGITDQLGGGSLRGMDLSWDLDRILFSYWLQPLDPSAPRGWVQKNAHIFEADLRSRTIRQVTSQPGDNDIEPCYLPNGEIIFASDRSSFGNQCAGAFLQDKRCTTLYRIDPRRGAKPVAISNNKDFDRHPHILNDGTVVFMHWEYQERDLYHLQTAWRCRPDGTNMDAFFKQHISVPYSIRSVQQAPDSPICVATAQGHHDAQDGPVILFNPTLGINNTDAMQLVTPGVAEVEGGLGPLYHQVVPEGGVENKGGQYIYPYPLSEKAFLVGHDMEGVGAYQSSPGQSDFAVYYIDVWGNRELIHRDKEMSCFMPHPLRRRKRPPVVTDTVDPDATYATAFVENVYRDLPGVKKGAVKYLRINQRLMLPAPVDYEDPEFRFNHLHWYPGDSTGVHFGYWTFAPTRTIGTVKVEEDGSAYFKVPAGTPVYLQALDENYCEIRRMRTSFTLQRGEFRGCTGCHESRMEAVQYEGAYLLETLHRGPQTPVPPPWGDCTVQDYRRDIQPIFDKHCVSCHGAEKPDADLDLTGRPVAGFTQSYRSLFGIGADDPQIVNDIKLHKDLHPEAANDAYVSQEAERPNRPRDLIKLIQQNKYPGQLVSISDKNSRDASVTQPYQFGSNKSRLIRVLLDDPMHRDEVKARLTREEWLHLVTWIDHNANFHSTLMDKSRYQREKKVTRVPYHLPDPWIPADLNPSFYNKKDSS